MNEVKASDISIRKVRSSADMADIFARVHRLPSAAFLDSSLAGKRGRFSVIATHPSLVLERREGRCFCNGKACKDSFEQELRTHLAHRRLTNPTNLPFSQGALGYFSYDYGRSLEHIESRHKPLIAIPEARMVFYDRLIVKDAATNNLFLIVQGHRPGASQVLDNLEHHVRHAQRFPAPQKATARASFSSSFSRQEYVETIERLIGYMRKGHCYVANLTQQLTVISTATPFVVYRYLRAHNPAPFSAFLNYPDVRVVCSSPERFIRTKGAEVQTCPIKGTLPRGAQALEDENLRRALQNSSKDLSELLMTVDLQRNDLNRVCVPGSVKVTRLGIHEPLFLNTAGQLTEGATSNLFFVRDGELVTPPTTAGLLAGIMRDFVCENFKVIERTVLPEEVHEFDEVFLTNSLMIAMPVVRLDHTTFRPGNMAEQVRAAYRRYLTNRSS